MKWFQHDSDASHDAKIKKLILKHGAIGYAIYFHCLELIAGTITQSNINFELEHDSEIIADNLKIQSNQDESGIDLVNRIMKSIIELGLFTCQNDHIFCYKLAYRLDNTISRSSEINGIKEKLRINNVVTTKKLLPEEIREDKNKSNKNKIDKIRYGSLNNVFLTEKEYNKLNDEYGYQIIQTYLDKLSVYIPNRKKYPYKDHCAAIRAFLLKDKIQKIEKKIYKQEKYDIME